MFLKNLVSVFIVSLLASGHLLAMELGDSFQENISSTQMSSHIPDSGVPELLPNVWYHIFDLYNALPGEVLTHHKVRQEPKLNKEAGRYFRGKINLLLGQMNTFKPTLSPQKFALIFSQTVNTDLCIKDTFFKLLGEIIAKEPFFFVAVGSPLVPILQEKYLSPESPYDHLNEYDLAQEVEEININKGSGLSQYLSLDPIMNLCQVYFSPNNDILETSQELYQALFSCELPTPTEEDKECKITAFNHLLAAWPLHGVYVTKKQKQQAIECFFKQHKDTLMGALSFLYTQIPYLSFGNLPIDLNQLKNQSYHIVITDEQLVEKKTRDELEALLQAHSGHMVTLSVGEDSPFVKEGCLNLRGEKVPPSLQRLRIVNPKGTIKEIGDGFLDNIGLIYFDAPGFINVKKIGSHFLAGTKIISLETSWLINVEKIGNCFLVGCESLSFLGSTGFISLKEFGAYFLLQCTSLPPFEIPGYGFIPSLPRDKNRLSDLRKKNNKDV